MSIDSRVWDRAAVGVAVLLAFALLFAASVAHAAGRVALVVGNSTYAHIGRLPNPGNDAADMAAALRRLGFEVTTTLDADRGELNDALRAFTRQSAGADVSLVFYAGHGIEMDGVNYLVPVDARLERDVDVRFEAVALDDVLVSTTGASLRLVVLDACRNNPLARSMQRTGASRSVSRGSFGNLDESLLGNETLVAYAAAAGTTAADGTGRNSPYTSALLAYLEEPVELLTLFRQVRAQVLATTNGEQRPHEYQSLLGEHYLGGAPAPGSGPGRDPRLVEAALGLDRAMRRRAQQGLAAAGFSPGPADGVFGPGTRAAIRRWQASRSAAATGYLDAASAQALGVAPVSAPAGGAVVGNAAASVQAQNVFWQSIAASENPADYEAYLEQFPAGIFARLARNRLAELEAGIPVAASDPPRVDEPRPWTPGTVFRDCATCPEIGGGAGGPVPDGVRIGQRLSGRRAAGARGAGGVVRAGGLRGDVRGVRAFRAGYGTRPPERLGLGPGRPPRDQRVVAGRAGVCGVAVARDGRGVPAAERVGVGVRGARGVDDAVFLGAGHRSQPGELPRLREPLGR